MKNNKITFLLPCLLLSLFSCSKENKDIKYTKYEESTVEFDDFSNPNGKDFDKFLYYRNDLSQDMGDPMMVYYNNKFYAYGTYDTTKIWTFSSDNLTDWKKEKACFTPEINSWSKRNIWAPDLQYINGKWYMYYTAQYIDKEDGSSHCQIGVAVGDSPDGIFTQYVGKNADNVDITLDIPPFLLKGITVLDQHVFQDDDGQLYMYFSVDTRTFNDDRNQGVQEIYGVKMKDPVTADFSTLTRLIAPGYKKLSDSKRTIEWETWSPSFANGMQCLEGPYMIKKNGKYFLTYVANSYVDTEYGVGYAISDSPLGEYVKPDDTFLQNLLLGVPGQTGTYINTRYLGFQTGTGHASICKVGDEYMFAYHAHMNRDKWGAKEDEFGEKSKYRALATDYLYFDKDGYPYTNGPTYSLNRLPNAVTGYKNLALDAKFNTDGTNPLYLNDNFTNRAFNTLEVNKESEFNKGKHLIEIKFDKEVEVKAVNIFNSYDYSKTIKYINQIDFGNNNGVTNILLNTNYINNDTKFSFPHSSLICDLKKTIKTNRIVIEIESDKDFALGEIEVLGR